MNAMYKTVVFLATAVALLFGFIPLAMADFEPPDRIVIPKFCGKPIEWKVHYKVSWVPNPKVSEPFRVGFVKSEGSLPNQGLIFGDQTDVRQDYISVLAHSGGGSTIDLRPRKQEVQIRMIGIRASHSSGAYFMYLFDRKANMNVMEAQLASDASGNCRSRGL